jgi:hypothetical protein
MDFLSFEDEISTYLWNKNVGCQSKLLTPKLQIFTLFDTTDISALIHVKVVFIIISNDLRRTEL